MVNHKSAAVQATDDPSGKALQIEGLQIEFATTVDSVGRSAWNRLSGTANPFCRFEFLQALERTECVGLEQGWQPQHLLIVDAEQRLVGVMPSYLKHHSYGEYVFDWAWASAYQRHHQRYYPKLLSAIPFTPSVGPRLMLDPALDKAQTSRQVVTAIQERLETSDLSSWHLLFPDDACRDAFQGSGLTLRLGCQYQWHNPGYGSFDDFLDQLTSRKRKSLKKERRQVSQQGIRFVRLEGAEIDERSLRAFYLFYQSTYLKRGQTGYLSQAFFQQLIKTMPEQVLLVMAIRTAGPEADDQGRFVAGALFLKNATTLFGRYWGCVEEYRHLHFECCYYQGIDYCIHHRLERFDAGAQGEHKIQRGFRPIATYSLHWIRDQEFRAAIDHFVRQEATELRTYMAQASRHLPFKSGPPG